MSQLPDKPAFRRTKIVATLGPASRSPEIIRQLILAGMDVARINFSHGSYDEHHEVISNLRMIADELQKPVTILQDLQGPKIRVGKIDSKGMELRAGQKVSLVFEKDRKGKADEIPIDYPFLSEEAKQGMQVLLADGLFELKVVGVSATTILCEVIQGGMLTSRKGVNFPNLNLRLPSLTDKDLRDLEFGLSQDVDWISLSFVRSAQDVIELQEMLRKKNIVKPVIAKIEKPQAIEHLEEIISVSDGIMVARGDLGVELSPERVPLLQKKIIELCNRRGIPVITATQMLESMIHEPRPTRAEASDVANAIIDGTDAVMLSGESAMGQFPVKSVEMMARIATEVEANIIFKNYPPKGHTDNHAIAHAANMIEDVIGPACIVVLTTSGKSATLVAAERPSTPIIALIKDLRGYHALNLLWGIHPIHITAAPSTFDGLINLAEKTVKKLHLASPCQRILVVGGIPANEPGGTNFIKIHTIQ
ncbi:MAG: pyruvate kinase [Bacteroidetes bacterium]|nr:pyruvate kinase [Bacteroidota bacterium]